MFWLRVNGRGNAWPIQLGKSHPMYQEDGINEYANASYAICKTTGSEYNITEIEWEIWVDAGHGTPSAILNHHNRIPDAIVLTHPHFDHILGVDYIVQCYYRQNQKRYPVYASEACVKMFQATLSHLNDYIHWNILPVAHQISVNEAAGLSVTAFPVYHGLSAKGASMLLLNHMSFKNKLLITGDVLFPLIQEKYLTQFSNIHLMLVDTNNRFPSPKTNHWSLINNDSSILNEFLSHFSFESIRQAHQSSEQALEYVNTFIHEVKSTDQLISHIFQFATLIKPDVVGLVHYSGAQDKEYYQEAVLNTSQLQEWVNQTKNEHNLSAKFTIPKTGELYQL